MQAESEAMQKKAEEQQKKMEEEMKKMEAEEKAANEKAAATPRPPATRLPARQGRRWLPVPLAPARPTPRGRARRRWRQARCRGKKGGKKKK